MSEKVIKTIILNTARTMVGVVRGTCLAVASAGLDHALFHGLGRVGGAVRGEVLGPGGRHGGRF